MKSYNRVLVTVLVLAYTSWGAWAIYERDEKITQLKAELVVAKNEQVTILKIAKAAIDDVVHGCEVQMGRVSRTATNAVQGRRIR